MYYSGFSVTSSSGLSVRLVTYLHLHWLSNKTSRVPEWRFCVFIHDRSDSAKANDNDVPRELDHGMIRMKHLKIMINIKHNN